MTKVIQKVIPKNIFMTWETNKNEISSELLYYVNSWEKYNPNYKIQFYNKEERYQFIKDNFDSKVLNIYNRLKPGALKADLWRYCVLYIYGGFYVDIDTECFSSLDNLIDENTRFICPIDSPTKFDYYLANGFLGSISRHSLLKRCIDHIIEVICTYDPKSKILVTNISGPGCLGINMNKYLNLPWNCSFINKEGMITPDIKLLKFEKNSEFIYDIKNKITILQNKNGNPNLIKAYKNECSKIKHICWGKFGEFTNISNVVDYNKKQYIFNRDEKITKINNYHDNKPAYFYLYENDNGPSACIKRGWRWEEHQHDIIDTYLNKNSVAIEIGSHIGTITIKLSKAVKKVYAFEPIHSSYTLLNDNLKLNHCNNTITYEKGCGDMNKNVKVKWISNNNPGGIGLEGGFLTKDNNTDEDIQVEIIKLDSMEFEKIDFIKIDVEGYEELVIQGAQETIKKNMPLIIMECFNKETFNNHIYDAKIATNNEIRKRFKFLIDLEYSFKHIAFEDFLFIPPSFSQHK